ncbi:hypothetical protein Q6346_13085 [Isoptericola sp. b490]|uniref:hypothetical protein n=1 Tax=Actinotalea lenta TaxID=3064654 RepID=UPI0027130585|nr:hypothetical protein [Isoptericola sp. b490]MDO8122245.1 hypothetical protein [Isoptericola sp. b490]
MTRPCSWYPLATRDPVPGDPGAVRAAASAYRGVAADIQNTAEALGRVAAAQEMVSAAVSAVRGRARQVASEIGDAHGRYEAVGDALADYAVALDRAQVDSLVALQHAQRAEQARNEAEAEVRRWALVSDEPGTTAASAGALARARAARDDAVMALARAQTELDHVVQLRDRAAQRAVDRIEEKTRSDGLHDSVWENVSDAARVLSEVASAVGNVAGVATIVLGWVPILGEILAATATVAAIVKTVADLALAAAREGGGWDLAIDAVGFATLGLGRVAANGIKEGRVVMREVAHQRSASKVLRSGNPARRADPEALVPDVLKGGLERPPIRSLSELWTVTKNLNDQIKELPMGIRLIARMGDPEVYVERAALAGSEKLAGNSTLVREALDAQLPALRLDVGVRVVDHVLDVQGLVQGVADAVASDDPVGLR